MDGNRSSPYLSSERVVSGADDSVKGELTGARGLTAFLTEIERLSEDDKNNIVDQAICMLEGFYAHLPLKRAMHAADPIQQLRILKHRLPTFTSEFEFHHQMTKTFTSLRDLHTNYLLPSYFARVVAFLPFRIKHCGEGDETKYIVFEIMKSVVDPNFVPGVELTYWNAVPIRRAVELAANYHAGSNLAARHARGVDGLTHRSMIISPPPDEEWVTVGYRGTDGVSRELRVEWTVTDLPDEQESAAELSADAAMAMGLDIEGDTRRRMTAMLFRPHLIAAKRRIRQRQDDALRAATTRGESIAAAEKVATEETAREQTAAGLESTMPDVLEAKVLTRDGRSYGYLRIRTFNVRDDEAFVSEAIRLLEHPDFPQDGLIIDVRGNGGGLIWASERMLQLFTPKPIEPTRVQFIVTPLTKVLCDVNEALKDWSPSLQRATETGAPFSAAFPITPIARCNDIGQRYYGPVVLITDARCYSATDMFAAGFRDHSIGKILGVDHNLGAGGANVWTLSLIRRSLPREHLPAALKEELPRLSNMRVAIRRCLRVGKEGGTEIEDLGIIPDKVRPPTRNDLLHGDVDLFKFAMQMISEEKFHSIALKSVQTGDITKITIGLANITRVDTYVGHRPRRSDDTPGDTLEIEVAAPFGSTVELRGFDGDNLVARRMFTIGDPRVEAISQRGRSMPRNFSRVRNMDEGSAKEHRDTSRKAHNDEFVERLFRRRPQAERQSAAVAVEIAAKLEAVPEAADMAIGAESGHLRPPTQDEMVKETIVRRERPVLFVREGWIDTNEVTVLGEEAQELVDKLSEKRAAMQPIFPLIGRIDVVNFPGNDYVGTGWFVAADIVVTNRHVASLIARWDGRKFAFTRGVGGRLITSSFNTLHEFDDLVIDAARAFAVTEVLYIEPEPGPDIAFLRVSRRTDGLLPDHIAVARTDVGEDTAVFVVGYPARAPRSVIPDQDLMRELYRGRFDVKRAAPGFTMSPREGSTRHDCTTLGGNSGSVVLDLNTGEAIGLHFAGLYQESNFAVRASLLNDYITKRRWNRPINLETDPLQVVTSPQTPQKPKLQSPAGQHLRPQAVPLMGPVGAVTITVPLSITVSLGQPLNPHAIQVSSGSVTTRLPDPAAAESAAIGFWQERPDGVIAVRVGFFDEDDRIGDTPYIAASVQANRLSEVEERGPTNFQGFDVRYIPATIAEQIDAMPGIESVDSIAYDDNARTGKEFSFARVDEPMTVRAHVGPEFSWDELKGFLSDAKGHLVSAMYEFHAPQIKDALEARLKAGAKLTLVLDNATFSEVKDEEMEFNRIAVFDAWDKKFKSGFTRIVAPEGTSGLISDAYHIKVTVRSDDKFWLSSGNWKKQSSQPVITQDERDNATDVDLPGNREWHVIVKNKTLASRFRSHILQDFARSEELGGGKLPKSKEAADILVDVPIDEGIVLERRPPSRLLEPRAFNGKTKARPLLTPDQEGAVYSQAVLSLINSAKKSLLFQIPYIGMPPVPNVHRGFIDDLIEALTRKLKTLNDARVILRSGGAKFSSPAHAAWFFKSKGVDIDNCLRLIEDHHTKGMIVDGKTVLIGSHNWSKPGVTLNRDASLIFESSDIAGYFAEAFQIDWDRSNPIKPKKFVKKETVVQEAVGAGPPPGFRRVRLSELLTEDD